MSVTKSGNLCAMDEAALGELLGRPVASAARYESAGISEVFLVTFGDGERVVVKRAPENWHWSIDKEAFVYGLVAGAVDVPVPEVLASPAPGMLVLSHVEGDGTAVVATADLYRQIGSMLARLHAVQVDAFGYIGTQGIVEPHDTNGGYMRHQFAKKLEEHTELGGDESLGIRIATHVAERAGLFDSCVAPSLCHNDCHEGNLIVRDGRIVALVDFQNAVGGDPLLDLAKSVCYTQRDRETVVAALAEGYGPLPNAWRETLDLYVLYHQLELWDWFATIGAREHLDQIEGAMRAAIG